MIKKCNKKIIKNLIISHIGHLKLLKNIVFSSHHAVLNKIDYF